MRFILTTYLSLLGAVSFGQNHHEWMPKITTVEDAERYASKHRDVSVTLVNSEQDRFLFDNIDTTDLRKHVGETNSLFGRSTKLLKDTLISMVDVQMIVFDPKKTSYETINILLEKMRAELGQGKSYWDLRKIYGDTDAKFWSGPEKTHIIEKTCDIDLSGSRSGDQIDLKSNEVKVGMLFLSKAPHKVHAFYSISYNN